MKTKIIASVICFFLLVLSAHAANKQPKETIKTTIDSIITTISNNVKEFTNGNNTQRTAIWENIKGSFDFNEISKRTLSRNWNNFSTSEKKNFSDVFGQFLGNIYIDKIQDEYKNEKILYVSEEILGNTHAIVRTKVVRNTLTIPIDYKLIDHDNKNWKIYDIVVEGVSLVANYRTQFNVILRKETPAQLIERLNQKLTKQKKNS